MLRFERPVMFATWLVITLRIAFGIVAALSVALDPRPLMRGIAVWTELDVPRDGLAKALLSPWQRWDGLWYQHIAEQGYSSSDGSLWFFPLYPMLSRVVSFVLLGQTMLAMLVVSTVASVIALWLLQRLAASEAGPATARVAAVSTALFPTGFFLLAPFTESLFLALSIGTFVALRENRPWLAALTGLAASLTRGPGILLVIPIAVYVLNRIRTQRRVEMTALACLLPAFGPAMHDVYATSLGLQGSILSLQALWGVRNAPPWEAISDSLRHIATTGDANEIVNIACLVFAAAMLMAWRRMPLDLMLYGAASLLLLLTRDLDNISPLLGASRYVLVIFPCFLALSRLLTPRPWLAASWLVVSGSIELVLLSYFARWGFVA